MHPLVEASIQGDTETIRSYLKNQGIKRASAELNEAFRAAVFWNQLEVVRVMLSHVDINEQEPQTARTALHIAAQEGHLLLIKSLVEQGAMINARDSLGRTPLHVAIDSEIDKAIDLSDKVGFMGCSIPPSGASTALLIALGADLTAKTYTGETPLDAASDGHIVAQHLLRERGVTE